MRISMRPWAIGCVLAFQLVWLARMPALAQAVSPVDAAPAPAPAPSPAPPSLEAGLGKGATVRSGDGRFTLNLRARVQIRATVAGSPRSDDDPTSEMAIRRMRLVLQGQALGPSLTYYLQLGFSNQDMERDLRIPVRDAFLVWSPLSSLSVRAGQMKVPYGRQRVNSSSALQMVDRSLVVNELNLDRDVGVSLFSKDLLGLDGRLGFNLSLFGGDGRNRLGGPLGYLYVARIEAWPLGPFDDYVEADVQRQKRLRLAFGAGVAYNQKTSRPRSTIGDPYPSGAHFNYLHAGVDACLKFAGLTMVGELMVREANVDQRTVEVDDAPVVVASRSAWGGYVQAGQMLAERLELAARYGQLRPKRGTDPTLAKSHELGGALSYYVMAHDLKVQGDYFYLPIDGFGEGVHQGRVQAQLYF